MERFSFSSPGAAARVAEAASLKHRVRPAGPWPVLSLRALCPPLPGVMLSCPGAGGATTTELLSHFRSLSRASLLTSACARHRPSRLLEPSAARHAASVTSSPCAPGGAAMALFCINRYRGSRRCRDRAQPGTGSGCGSSSPASPRTTGLGGAWLAGPVRAAGA